MRRAEKEQIKQVITLQKEILQILVDKTHIENIDQANTFSVVLQECQQAITAVGKSLEKSEAEYAGMITSLEKYCEKLYQIAEVEAKQSVMSLYQEAVFILEETISRLEQSSEKEVVCFLPYKASMWDSLESVWREAVRKSDCEVYVIPIPYFDRHADGSFGKMHYEGEAYPDYVPITHYESFDIEELRPDKIYIHNPYDEYNTITSVYPEFYSSKLKNYTKELVYIPYFVLNEIDPNDALAIEGIEHFCMVPAVLHAHKVIVQSEEMKQIYVNVLTKWQGEHTRAIWEKKILGLGSPKFDKVANVVKEEIIIPKEWQSILQKPDGTWKKIIFYNTSIAAFLKNSEQMLKKIADVFRVIAEYKDEIVLWWRPHPLMLATITAMRPELVEAYQNLVDEYRKKQIGIYDDTADLNRAIALADAYFGDLSSVVQLCQKVKMPVMIQDVKVDYE